VSATGTPKGGVGPAGLDRPKQRCGQAYERIRPHIEMTPCVTSEVLDERVCARIFLKLENRQLSGSFKLRGVMNKILALDPADRKRPLVAASTGNHAAAFAHALESFGLQGTLYLPHTIAPVKLAGLRATGVPLEFAGDDCVETEIEARRAARQRGAILVPP
jgi:threonine dehydratase